MLKPKPSGINTTRANTILINDEEYEVKELESVETDSGRIVTYYIPELERDYTYLIPSGTNYEENRRELSYMPVQYRSKKLVNFKWDAYGDIDTTMVREIAENTLMRYDEFIRSGYGLYIYSKIPGSGKTLLACALANEIIDRRNLSVKFITAPRYVDLPVEERREYMNCSLLILDDWGTQSEKQEWVVEVLFKLIDYRHGNNLPTFFTSNLAPQASTKSDRIFSRINEMTIVIKLPEYSVRDEQARKRAESFMKEILKNV